MAVSILRRAASLTTVGCVLAMGLAGGLAALGTAPAGADVAPNHGPAAGGAAVTGTVAGAAFTQISVGYEHTVALDGAGQAYTWGSGYWGNLGNGTSGSAADTAVPVKVSQGDLRFVKVSAGHLHTLALTDDGSVYAWGYGGSGRIGDGTTEHRSTPVRVSTPGGVVFKDVSAGGSHSVALTNGGQIYTWGDNGYRQLGRPGAGTTTPTVIAGTSGFARLGTFPDASSSFAMTAGGTGYAWGRNFSGQLGIGTVSEPDPGTIMGGVDSPTVMKGGPYAQIHSVGNRTTMLTVGGAVTTAGQQPTNPVSEAPTPVAVDTGGLRFRDLGVYNHVIALATDGRVYTWGSNEEGERGDGTFRTAYRAAPYLVTAGGQPVQATQVYAGRYFSLAHDSRTALVRGWGYGFSGQLGNGVEDRQPTPVVGPRWRVTGATFGGVAATGVSGTGSTWSATTPAGATGPVEVRVQATLHGGVLATASVRDLPAGRYQYGALPASTTRLTVGGTRVAGRPVTLAVTVSPASGGSIELRDGARVLGTVPVSAGRAVGSFVLSAGQRSLSARYLPASDALVAPSSSVTRVSIAKAKPTLTVRAPRQVVQGKKAVIRVSVGAPGLVATGKVTVSLAGRSASAVLRNGVATVTVAKLRTLGRQLVTVSYPGSSQLTSATHAKLRVKVVPVRR